MGGSEQAPTATAYRRLLPQAILGSCRWGFCCMPPHRILTMGVMPLQAAAQGFDLDGWMTWYPPNVEGA